MTAQQSLAAFPASDSPSLSLIHPTPAEKLATWSLNIQAWSGPLSFPAYQRREEHLSHQDLTRDGGMTFWILVDNSAPPSPVRRILASCETIKKRALLTRGDGCVEEFISYGILSVFCDPDLRGRGYAGRLMEELGNKLDTWGQEGTNKTTFTVLYSDIGKRFYTQLGWQPFPAGEITLPPTPRESLKHGHENLPRVNPLQASDLAELCHIDEMLLKRKLGQYSSKSSKVRVAVTPDVQTYQWHHAREEFLATELLGKPPLVKGAMVTGEGNNRVFCVWTRSFGAAEADNVLHILRLVIEDEKGLGEYQPESEGDILSLKHSSKHLILATAAVLAAAQREAAIWNMKNVVLWQPPPLAVLAAQRLAPAAKVTNRENLSIPSLRWYGGKEESESVEWVANERYAWC